MPGWDAGTHPGQAAGLAGQAGWRPQPLRGEADWTWPHAPCSLHRYASRAYPGHAARRAWPLHHQVYRLPKPVIPAGNCDGPDSDDASGLVWQLAGLVWQKVPAVRGACVVLGVLVARSSRGSQFSWPAVRLACGSRGARGVRGAPCSRCALLGSLRQGARGGLDGRAAGLRPASGRGGWSSAGRLPAGWFSAS